MTVNWEETYKIWKEFEGLELVAYPDPATHAEPWTIGYGHTGLIAGPKVRKGDKITVAQAEQFMKNDLDIVYAKLKALIKVELNPNQWAALISFGGNIKWSTVLKSSVLSYINKGRLSEVPGRMALYRLGDGKVMNGLVRRRSAEGALWMKPVSNTEQTTTKQIEEEVKETQGTVVGPASTKKPWDTGAIGATITFLAAQSDAVKKFVGNFTSAFGIPPTYLFIALVVGFAGWTIWNKWKGDK